MSIDYDAIGRAGGISKGRPLKTLRAEAKEEWQSIDDRESRKVRKRSGGQCEVRRVGFGRCQRRAFHVHHHMGGFGVRGRGDSALAKNKSHVCAQCHEDIGGKILRHDAGQRYRERR